MSSDKSSTLNQPRSFHASKSGQASLCQLLQCALLSNSHFHCLDLLCPFLHLSSCCVMEVSSYAVSKCFDESIEKVRYEAYIPFPSHQNSNEQRTVITAATFTRDRAPISTTTPPRHNHPKFYPTSNGHQVDPPRRPHSVRQSRQWRYFRVSRPEPHLLQKHPPPPSHPLPR